MSDVLPAAPNTNALAELDEGKRALTLASTPDESLHVARYAGAVVDYLRRAHQANPRINEALLLQVEALVQAADQYEAGVGAGEFNTHGGDRGNQHTGGKSLAAGLAKSELNRISEGRKLRDKDVPAYIKEHLDEPLALGALLRLKRGEHSFASVSDEWYTPAEILNPTRIVLGAIDLDPASSPEANQDVNATTFWTANDQPLEREWPGRIFLNPPFSRSADFVTKLIDEHRAGRTTQAILVINGNRFDARWFHPLWDHTLCFTYTRPPFRNPLMDYNDRPMGGTAIVYLGANKSAFRDNFVSLGAVVHRYA